MFRNVGKPQLDAGEMPKEYRQDSKHGESLKLRIFVIFIPYKLWQNNYNMGDTCSMHSAYETSAHNVASEKVRDPGIKKNTIIIVNKVACV